MIHDNPVAAVLTTWTLVQFFLLIGSLNRIAQLCSVLFLLSYASVNLACLGLDLAAAPNFRPRFKFFSWHTSLLGLIGTTVMMFFISPIFSAVSILLCFSLILALNVFSPVRNANWGSISQALLFHQVRTMINTGCSKRFEYEIFDLLANFTCFGNFLGKNLDFTILC